MIAVSVGTLERPVADDWLVLTDEFESIEFDPEPEPVDEPSLADRWSVEDPVDEILFVLNQTGRTHEAAVISKILDDRRDRRTHLSMLQSMVPVLAEDWDSPEDDFYDTL